MPLWKIAWRSIQRRRVASALTALSMALGVMLVVGVLVILGIVSESFRSNSTLGYNVVVGAKGGALQLVLNSVFYLSEPVENIDYAFYQEFLDAEARGDGVNGKWSEYVKFAIPICMGDYYREFRVVGTTPEMFEVEDPNNPPNKMYHFAEGRSFRTWDEEHGFFEAVVGARVAAEHNIDVGSEIVPTHGAEGAEHDKFFVVGILAPTNGTPIDRAVFVNMEGFYLLEGHAKPSEKDAGIVADVCSLLRQVNGEKAIEWIISTVIDRASSTKETNARASSQTSDNLSKQEESESVAAASTKVSADQSDANVLPLYLRKSVPLPVENREVTALLVRTNHPLVTRSMSNKINEGDQAQAVLPIREITRLFDSIVAPIQYALVALTALICVVSGIGIWSASTIPCRIELEKSRSCGRWVLVDGRS